MENQSKPTSWITFLPLTWLILQNSKGALFWKGNVDSSTFNQSQFEGSSFDRIVLSFLIVFAVYIFYSRRDKIFPIIKANIWLIGLLGYMLLSILWADYPFIALRRWVRTSGTIIMIGLLVTEKYPLIAGLKILKQACFFMLLISLPLIFIFPNIGTSLEPKDGTTCWIGITTHKNMLGQWSTLGALLFSWLLLFTDSTLKERIINSCMLAISIILLIGSRSTGSLSLTLEGIGLFIGFYLIKRGGKFGIITVPIIVISLGFLLLLVEQFLLKEPIISSVLHIAGKDSSLTGRTDLWDYAFSIGLQKIWFGHGYATFWISKWGDQARSILGWDMYSAHNGFLDVYLQLGIIGILFLVVYVIFALRSVFSVYRFNFSFGVFWITCLIVTMFSNLTESNFGVLAHEFWFLSVLVSFTIPSQFLIEDFYEKKSS